MRYVQLKAFHHVAIHASFSRAAEALHVTQPAVSDQVRKLESEYDIKLFERHGKQVDVTAIGQELLEITHRLFDIEQRAEDLLTSTKATHSGSLRIIVDCALHISPILRLFRQEFPSVFVSVKSGNSNQVIDQLNRYEADIAVLGNLVDEKQHKSVPLNSTPIIAFAATSTRFAARKSVGLKELSGWPLVLRERGSKTRARVEEQALKVGLSLNISIEAEGRESVRQIVADGGGVGIVSEAEFIDGPDLQKIRIRDVQLTMNEAIVCLRERSENPLIFRFMQLAEEFVNSSGRVIAHADKQQG